MSALRAARAALLVALLPLLPHAAEACAVCMSGREDDTGRALLKGTLLLSVLPLAMFGGILLYVRRRAKSRVLGS